MEKKLILISVLITCLLSFANGQTNKSNVNNSKNLVKDSNLGISFAKVGTVNQIDDSTYKINLSLDNSYVQNAVANITTSNKLFVDLSGSYGGKLFLDSPSAKNLLKDRMKVDSFSNGNQNFIREYWAVYAGMGMWDCVINCYAQKNGKYYIVSFVQDKQIGKPGEMINGNKLEAVDLKTKILSLLQDSSNSEIKNFNKLISSFQIIK